MIELSAAEVAAATGGQPRGIPDPHLLRLTHADTDSRSMQANSLFIAKPGEHTDGHRFIDSALAAGAQLVLAERATDTPDGTPHPAVIVPDVIEAMGALAAYVVDKIRQHSPTTVIGITGSAGKTTTKDLLRAILEPHGVTVAPQGSYNGEVGVPLTVFSAPLDTRYLVIEMGADGPGNIAYLAQMVKPDIGVVLMVGSAHAGKFGSVEQTARTKGELVEFATEHVVLNAEDTSVAAMAERAQAPVTWFSSSPDTSHQSATDYWADQLSINEVGNPQFTLVHGSTETAAVTSGLMGGHHITNLMAAAAAAGCAGIAVPDIAQHLTGLGPSSRWRMERTQIDWAGQPQAVTLINDAYNANPESMREALRTLAMLSRPATGPRRRSVAVLGAMLELGQEHIRAHTRIGETVVRLNIDLTLVVGQDAYSLYRGAIAEGSWDEEVHWVANAEEAETWLQATLQPADIVLFKSSRDTGLRLLGDRIAAQGKDWA